MLPIKTHIGHECVGQHNSKESRMLRLPFLSDLMAVEQLGTKVAYCSHTQANWKERSEDTPYQIIFKDCLH